jgi:hypothetical protein
VAIWLGTAGVQAAVPGVLCCAVLTPLPFGWVAGAFFVCMRVKVTCQLLNLGSSCFWTCTLCCSCTRRHECMLPQQLTPTEPARAADIALWLVWSTHAFNLQHGCGDSRTVNVMCHFCALCQRGKICRPMCLMSCIGLVLMHALRLAQTLPTAAMRGDRVAQWCYICCTVPHDIPSTSRDKCM